MKRISFLLAVTLLAAPVITRAQDAATEERLNKLSGQIQDLIERQETLGKRIEALSKDLLSVQQEQQNKPTVSYASQEDVKQLAAKLQEVDKKQHDDNALLLKELKNLGKTLGGGSGKKIIAATVPLTPTGDTSNTTSTISNNGYEYVIQSGDNLIAIAKAYTEKNIKVTVKQILAANPGLKPENMKVGQKIFIPAPQP